MEQDHGVPIDLQYSNSHISVNETVYLFGWHFNNPHDLFPVIIAISNGASDQLVAYLKRHSKMNSR